MGTVATAYAIVWLAVTAYVAMIGVRQRVLLKRLQSLESQIEHSNNEKERVSIAA